MFPARETFFPCMLTLSPAKPKSLLQSWWYLVLASPNKGPFTGLFTSFPLPHLPLLVIFGELIRSYHQYKAPCTKEFQMPKDRKWSLCHLCNLSSCSESSYTRAVEVWQQLMGSVHPRKSKCGANSLPCAKNPSPREAAGKQQGESQPPSLVFAAK